MIRRRSLIQFFVLSVALLACVHTACAQVPSGVVLWLRADSNVTVVDNQVERWADTTRNLFAFQESSSRQPAYVPNAVNGHAIVRFGGLNYLNCSNVFPVGTDYTVTVVTRINNFEFANNIVSGSGHAIYLRNTPFPTVLHKNFSLQAISSIPLDTSLAIVTVRYNQSSQFATVFINGQWADSGLVGVNNDSNIQIGAYQSANYLNGDIAEVVLYNSKLSESSRAQLESYLFTKYTIPIPPPPPTPVVTFASFPAQLALYARDAKDSATVPIVGTVNRTGFDSIVVDITKGGSPYRRVSARLNYGGGQSAPFSIMPKIHAELSEYSFTARLTSSVRSDTTIATRDSVVCGDVYLVNGQSNTVAGSNAIEPQEFCRTFGINASINPRDTLWALSDGRTTGGGRTVGGWAMRLQQQMQDSMGIPTCLINGGVGGTLIEAHQRNDAAPLTLTTIYGSLLYRVEKSGLRQYIKAFLWYQGESNSWQNYFENSKALCQDWEEDYSATEKFYVMQIHTGCGGVEHAKLREIQRTLADSLPKVVVHASSGLPGHDGCHFIPAGYTELGTQVYHLLARDLYASTDTIGIRSPNIIKSMFMSPAHDRLALVFRTSGGGLSIQADTTVGSVDATIADAFFVNDSAGLIASVQNSGDTLFLNLKSPSNATTVSYVPDKNYTETNEVFQGPWIRSGRGVGALTFYRFPITDDPSLRVEDRNADANSNSTLTVTGSDRIGYTIHFTVRSPGDVQLTLWNSLGELTTSLVNGYLPIGTEQKQLPFGLIPGLYFVRLVSGHTVITHPLVITGH